MTDLCIDAEVLAAWVDGTLDERTAADVERHAAGCARCQAMLAAFVRTEPVSASPAVPENVLAPWWQSLRIRWIVPIAAAATAVAIWIAVPAAPKPEGKLAGVPEESAAPSLAPVTPSTPAAAPGATPPGVGAEAAQAPQALKPDPQGTGETRQEAEPDSTQRERAETVAAEQRAPDVARAPSSPATVNRNSEPMFRSALGDSAAAEFVSRDGAVRWRLTGAGVERSTDGGTTWIAALLTSDRALDAPGAASPRAGGAAVSRPAEAVMAGDAPTASLCWLVGSRGVVWITTDGGARFRRTTVTGEPDLRAVAARDERSAEVTTVDGRVFRTDDSGTTWRLEP